MFSIAPKERRFHGVKFPVLRCQSKVLNLEPNTTILFRQCMPHQGMFYEETNVRIFSYVNCRLLPTAEDELQTVRIQLNPSQWISLEKLKENFVSVPREVSNIKKEKRKYSKKILV